jgi:magnesium chelatase family protein
MPVRWSELDAPACGPTSTELRTRVADCRRVQQQRGRSDDFLTNAEIPDSALDRCVLATPDARRLLGRAVEKLGLSARVARRLLRVARTIADLARDEKTGPGALAEALSYRATTLGPSSGAEFPAGPPASDRGMTAKI